MNHANFRKDTMPISRSILRPVVKPASVVPARTLHSLLSLAAENRSAKIPAAISRAVANTMQAEVCFLLSIPDTKGNISVFDGFNLKDEAVLPGRIISSSVNPALADKLLHSQPYWNNDPEDVSCFISNATIKQKATVCMCPLITTQREPIGGIILLSPVSHRVWVKEDLIQLTAMVDSIARILQRVDYLASLEEKLAQATAPKPIKTSDGLQSQIAETSNKGKDRILPAVEPGTLAMATGGPYVIANDIPETESIRSAISAIGGYIQLLMSESAGPLTSMQKKFLERVHVAAGKISQSITSLEKGNPSHISHSVNEKVVFKPVIKDILFEFGTLIDQKAIKVELVIPRDLPEIISNKENIIKVLRTVLFSTLFEAPSNGKMIILLKSVNQVKSRGGILCSIISILLGSDIKPPYIPIETDHKLEHEVSSFLTSVNGQIWVNQTIHQEKTVHLFFGDHSAT